MRLWIACEECGHRQRTERRFFDAQRVYLICHECECPLAVEVTLDSLTREVFQQVMAR